MNIRLSALALFLAMGSLVRAEEVVWTGDRIVDAPVVLKGQTLRIEPGSRIAFKGEGRLIVGGLVARDVVFGARDTLTNEFRIVQRGGDLALDDCRFLGLTTVKPAKEHFLRGFIMSMPSSGARISHCTMSGCSPVMIVDAKKAEVCGNLVSSCSEGIIFLDCTECSVKANEFFDATDSGLLVSGTRLSELAENRFTDCETGLTVRYCGTNRFVGNAFFGCREGVLLHDVASQNRFLGTRFEGCGRTFTFRGRVPGCIVRRTEIDGRAADSPRTPKSPCLDGADLKARLIAHRGESHDAPENTLPAYQMAVNRDFGFECDVYLSADGQVFTFHDSTLKRTTAGANTNSCEESSWNQTISKLDVGSWGKWKGSAYAGTRPALLKEVLALARPGRRIYVEIKSWPEIIPYVKDVFAAEPRATPETVLFISFDRDVCRELKVWMPDYTVYYLCGYTRMGSDGVRHSWGAEDLVRELRTLGVDGVDICYDSKHITRELVEAVKAAGYGFHVWTVDDPDKAREAFARGVETVTTNRAKFLYEELGK